LLALPSGAAAFGPLGSFGEFGTGAGELRGPKRGSVSAGGTLFVTEHSSNRISVFLGDGSFLRAFGKGVNAAGFGDPDVCITACQASADGQSSAGAMSNPEDAAAAPNGRVYVSDSGNNRVSVFSAASGDFLFAFGKGVKPGGGNLCDLATGCEAGPTGETDSGALSRPAGLTADSARVYVGEIENNRVSVFDLDGGFLFAFGKGVNAGAGDPDICTTQCQAGDNIAGPGVISSPEDVAVGPEGNVFVADGGDNYVAVFSAAGEFIDTFGDSGPEALVEPTAIASDDAGALWVADSTADSVKRFSAAGAFLAGFPAAARPMGVAPACGGNLFVISEDIGDAFSRVERYGEPGAPVPPCAKGPESVSVTLIPFVAPSNRVRFRGLRLNRRNGSAVLLVRVAGPGRVLLKGRGVRRLSRGALRAKVVRLPVKPKVRLRHFVKRHGKGRIRVEVTFRPVGGEPRTIEKVIVLRRR
jgi:DNA-binding beta-propeller fold protein YncE